MILSKYPFALVGIALSLCLAAVPSSAALLPVDAQFELFLGNAGPSWDKQVLRFPVAAASGAGNSVGGGGATVPAGLFAGNASVSIPISPAFLGFTRITVPGSSLTNPAGSFAPNGAMGLSGAVFFQGGGTVGSIPLAPIGGYGSAGFALGPLIGTLYGATWMGDANGTLAGGDVFTMMGALLSIPITAAETAYDNRTANGAGTMQLVAPAYAYIPPFGDMPTFGVLTLTYTPEPSTLLLLGGGIALLVGRRKMGRR